MIENFWKEVWYGLLVVVWCFVVMVVILDWLLTANTHGRYISVTSRGDGWGGWYSLLSCSCCRPSFFLVSSHWLVSKYFGKFDIHGSRGTWLRSDPPGCNLHQRSVRQRSPWTWERTLASPLLLAHSVAPSLCFTFCAQATNIPVWISPFRL